MTPDPTPSDTEAPQVVAGRTICPKCHYKFALLVPDYEQLAAEREQLAQALREVEHDLTGLCIYLKAEEGKRHTDIGEACGVDACIVCLAEATAQEAAGIAREALNGSGDTDGN